jgi:hypothetical protein
MMGGDEIENKFWLRIWGLLALVLVALIGSCSFIAYDKLNKWEKAVSNGADPMVAACALFDQRESERVACAMLARDRK